MIIADKIIRMRKKNGWSQEELAEKMNVSRQAVSKWESAQTVPDINKILQLSELFGVTTDYLLKDEIENEEFTDDADDIIIKRITLSEANGFIEWRKNASLKIAVATFLCIIAVIPLLVLSALSEFTALGISDELAVIIGLVSLFVFVTVAVMLFVYCGMKNAPYEFIDKEPFETEYGVKGLVQEKKKAYMNTYTRSNIIGTCLCVFSPVALLIGTFSRNELVLIMLLCVTLLIAGIGVLCFIISGVRMASMRKILKDGEYSISEKRKSGIKESISTVYWLITTAVYLGWSFSAEAWKISWIVWPISAVLFSAVMIIFDLIVKDKE